MVGEGTVCVGRWYDSEVTFAFLRPSCRRPVTGRLGLTSDSTIVLNAKLSVRAYKKADFVICFAGSSRTVVNTYIECRGPGCRQLLFNPTWLAPGRQRE
jgi:hypothetical protein